MELIKSYDDFLISKNLKYHINNGLTLSESIFRVGSDSYHDLINEVRSLWLNDEIKLNSDDQFIVEKLQTGVRAKWKGESVVLDSPKRGGDKKFYVYHNSGRKDKEGNIIAKKIAWGDKNLKVKNFDDKARLSFLKRHDCDNKNDQSTPGWWACNVHKFWKQLGLTSSKRW